MQQRQEELREVDLEAAMYDLEFAERPDGAATRLYGISMIKLRSALGVALVSLVWLSGCGGAGKPNAAKSPSAPTSSIPNTPTLSASPTAVPSPPAATQAASSGLLAGQTFVGMGESVTVYSWQTGGYQPRTKPDPGTVWFYVDAKYCNTGSTPAMVSTYGSWIVKLDGDYQIKPADITPKPRTPTLPEVYEGGVSSGDCVRGWITFAVPEGAVVKQIRYKGEYRGSGEPAIWHS